MIPSATSSPSIAGSSSAAFSGSTRAVSSPVLSFTSSFGSHRRRHSQISRIWIGFATKSFSPCSWNIFLASVVAFADSATMGSC